MKKFEWLDIPKDAARPWKGLPFNRALDSSDLSWFKKTPLALFCRPLSSQRGNSTQFDNLRAEMRRIYNECSR